MSHLLPPLERRFRAIHIIITTNFAVVSSIGIKRVNCNNFYFTSEIKFKGISKARDMHYKHYSCYLLISCFFLFFFCFLFFFFVLFFFFSPEQNMKGSIFLINRYFIIQERFNKFIYGSNTIIKCGT